MIENKCQVCESTIFQRGREIGSACNCEITPPREETDVYFSVGAWSRSYVVCANCAKRLIRELDSFVHDSRAFTQMTLGELQARMDSVARN